METIAYLARTFTAAEFEVLVDELGAENALELSVLIDELGKSRLVANLREGIE